MKKDKRINSTDWLTKDYTKEELARMRAEAIKEAEIEEMAKDFCAVGIPCEECHLYKNRCHAKKYATRAYNAGYRKASEVAEEIFAEIDKHIQEKKKAISMFKDGEDDFYDGEIHALEVFAHLLAELKNKYAEGEKDDV